MYIHPSHFVLGSNPLVQDENQRIIAARVSFQRICSVFIFFAETLLGELLLIFLQLFVYHAMWLENILEL